MLVITAAGLASLCVGLAQPMPPAPPASLVTTLPPPPAPLAPLPVSLVILSPNACPVYQVTITYLATKLVWYAHLQFQTVCFVTLRHTATNALTGTP